MELRQRALELLRLADPGEKAIATRALFDRMQSLPLHSEDELAEPSGLPGRPPLPRLVAHVSLARRSPFTPEGRAALLHAVVHINFNAPSSSRARAGVRLRGSHACQQFQVPRPFCGLTCRILSQRSAAVALCILP